MGTLCCFCKAYALVSKYQDLNRVSICCPYYCNGRLSYGWLIDFNCSVYADNEFPLQIEKQEIGLNPMNCPGHCLMFQHRVRSYRGKLFCFFKFLDTLSHSLQLCCITTFEFSVWII